MDVFKSRLRSYRVPAFLLAAALLGGVAATMVTAIRGYTRSIGAVEHSYQVMAAAEAVRSSLRAAESHARGYRLTGQAPMLAEYLADVPEIRHASAELVALTVDNPIQQARSRQLAAQAGHRLATLQGLIDVQTERGPRGRDPPGRVGGAASD